QAGPQPDHGGNAGCALPDRRDAGPHAEGTRQWGNGDRVEGTDHPRGVLCWLAVRGQRWPYRHRCVRTEIALVRPSPPPTTSTRTDPWVKSGLTKGVSGDCVR